MRTFRRLPPLLRGVSLLALLPILAALVIFLELLLTPMLPSVPHWSADHNTRMAVIALNLINVGWAGGFPSRLYLVRWRRPDHQLFPLESWQSQVRTVLLLTALPLGLLALAVVIPPTSRAFAGVFALCVLEALVIYVATLRLNRRAARSELTQPL
jgi:hypothetical protein